MKPHTRNVTRAYRAATEDQRARGIEWYSRARDLAEELDPSDIDRAAAVIAVLSPRQSWSRNVDLARQAYSLTSGVHPSSVVWTAEKRTERRAWILTELPTLGRQREQVARLLVDGADPDDMVSGPKVRAFWRTIVDPFDPRTVVVDRHAIDVACGQVLDDHTRGALVGRKGAYDILASCYIRAARILSAECQTCGSGPLKTSQGRIRPAVVNGTCVECYSEQTLLTPAQVQAVTWTHWRETHAPYRAANIRSNNS